MKLVPLSKLSDTHDHGSDPDAAEAAETPHLVVAPQDAVLPWTYTGRGRGVLIALCVLGLIAFGSPWVYLYAPDRVALTGVDIARRTGLTWSVGVAWFTLLPLVLSRRSIRTMRGARLAVAMLAAIPLLAAGVLLLNPPVSAQAHAVVVHLRFRWAWGVFATVALGAVATALGGGRFGGKMDDITVTRGSSAGHTLH